LKYLLEKDIEKQYVKLATAIGCIPIKMNVVGAKNRPDRLVCLAPGGIIWLEFKKPGAKVYPGQAEFHRQLHERNQICETFDDENYAIAFTQACMESARLSGGGGPCYADPSLCGPTYGSRPREDIYSAFGLETPEALRRQQEIAGDSTVEGLLQRMAARSGEVGEFRRSDSEYYSRAAKRSLAAYRSGHTPDKP
jgi:hypothetical protein